MLQLDSFTSGTKRRQLRELPPIQDWKWASLAELAHCYLDSRHRFVLRVLRSDGVWIILIFSIGFVWHVESLHSLSCRQLTRAPITKYCPLIGDVFWFSLD